MHNILWADDRQDELFEIISYLEIETDYSFDKAENLTFAIEKIIERDYDIVVIDLIMPAGRVEKLSLVYQQMISDDKYSNRSGLAMLEIIFDLFNSQLNGRKMPKTVIFSNLPSNFSHLEIIQKASPIILDKKILNDKEKVSELFFKIISGESLFKHSILNKSVKLEEEDISRYIRIIHNHLSYLNSTKRVLQEASLYLYSEFGNSIKQKEQQDYNNVLRKKITALINVSNRLKNQVEKRTDIPKPIKGNLKKIIKSIESTVGDNIFVQGTLANTNKLTNFLKQNKKVKYPKEPMKEINTIYDDIKRIKFSYDLDQNIKKVDDSISNMRRFINELNSSHKSSRKSDYYVNMLTVVDEVLEKNAGYAISRGVNLNDANFSVYDSYTVDSNPEDMEILINNLVNNAIKYSHPLRGGELPWVNIKLNLRSKFVEIEVESWGSEITKQEVNQKLIFKKGYRGLRIRDKIKDGTGFGLTESLNIAKKTGGNITFNSEKKTKTDWLNTFLVKLPHTF